MVAVLTLLCLMFFNTTLPTLLISLLLYIGIDNVCACRVIPYCFTYITMQTVQ